MADLTVSAIPAFAVTLAAEQRYLARRKAKRGTSPADYEPRDTRASLAMGTLSLLAPFVVPKLVAPFAPRGRYGKKVLGVAAAAAAITTIADLIERASASTDQALSPPERDRAEAPTRTGRARLARVASAARTVTAPVAVVAGGVAASSAWRSVTNRQFLNDRRLLPDLGNGPIPFAIAMVGWDFVYYWNHRFMHEARYMWAIHVVHHSSEHYNLSTALRQPVADTFGTYAPDGVMCLFGIRPSLIEQSRAINLLYQYWIHTDTIRSLGPLEWILNTPSHHRAHHGSNRQYLDRNHAGILIIWDRMFGTFERERESVVYGLTKNINSFHPVVIALHEYRDILRDVGAARNWHDRLSYVLRGPGWAYAHPVA